MLDRDNPKILPPILKKEIIQIPRNFLLQHHVAWWLPIERHECIPVPSLVSRARISHTVDTFHPSIAWHKKTNPNPPNSLFYGRSASRKMMSGHNVNEQYFRTLNFCGIFSPAAAAAVQSSKDSLCSRCCSFLEKILFSCPLFVKRMDPTNRSSICIFSLTHSLTEDPAKPMIGGHFNQYTTLLNLSWICSPPVEHDPVFS